MSTDPILLRAILAMDAYNRGYAPGIASLGGGAGAQIGEATLLNFQLPDGSQAAGFCSSLLHRRRENHFLSRDGPVQLFDE